MKKASIVCLEKYRRQTLERLRDLACIHVVSGSPCQTAELEKLRRRQNRVSAALAELDSVKHANVPRIHCRPGSSLAGQFLDELLETLDRQNALLGELQQTDALIAQFEPWGNFDFSQMERLGERGWHCALCVTGEGDDDIPLSTDSEKIVVERRDGKVYSLVVSKDNLTELNLPSVQLPHGTNLSKLTAKRQDVLDQLKKIDALLRRMAVDGKIILANENTRLEREIAFETAAAGMGGDDRKVLAYLTGYVPVSALPALEKAAEKNGWAVRCEDVAEDDEFVPTKLVLPKHMKMARLILDFIGVLPGYREIDVSVSVMVCLAFFCGMLVGDAGYGACFSLASAVFMFCKRHEPEKRQAGVLLLGMSLCILMWGALNGTWFGLRFWGIPWLAEDANGDHVKMLCFLIGAVHLSFAHFWKAAASHGLKVCLGNIGWALFIWGNFFTVKALIIDNSFRDFSIPGCLYGAGFLLVLLFGINWTSFGDVIYSPFNFINSVSDVLSYIRLYAVGLSSLYIAQAFNEMSASIWHVSPWMIPVGLLVVLAGHALNMGLSVMGVLVHGTRLNTLEFSGHIGLEWSGQPYVPFK